MVGRRPDFAIGEAKHRLTCCHRWQVNSHAAGRCSTDSPRGYSDSQLPLSLPTRASTLRANRSSICRSSGRDSSASIRFATDWMSACGHRNVVRLCAKCQWRDASSAAMDSECRHGSSGGRQSLGLSERCIGTVTAQPEPWHASDGKDKPRSLVVSERVDETS